jgi:hypothetical protein
MSENIKKRPGGHPIGLVMYLDECVVTPTDHKKITTYIKAMEEEAKGGVGRRRFLEDGRGYYMDRHTFLSAPGFSDALRAQILLVCPCVVHYSYWED